MSGILTTRLDTDGRRVVVVCGEAEHEIGVADPGLLWDAAQELLEAMLWLQRRQHERSQARIEAIQHEAKREQPKPGHHPTPDGHLWVCHHCSFSCVDLDGAEAHILNEPMNFGHWMYEHPQGNRGRPPTREMHSSDVGGVYLSPIPAAIAEDNAKRYRDRVGGGAH